MSATRGQARIVGWGMVSCLGLDAVTACAAARAGISRAEELDGFAAADPDGNYAPVIAHAVPFVTHGFEGDARLARLLGAALGDLGPPPSQPRSPTHKVGVYLSLPDPLRITTGTALLTSDEERTAILEEREEALELLDPQWARSLWISAVSGTAWSTASEFQSAVFSGHTGFHEAIRAALAELQTGSSDAALVAGVDSLLDENTLCWLEVTGRLKTASHATGLRPGEAAAAVLLVSAEGADATASAAGAADEGAGITARPGVTRITASVEEVMQASDSESFLEGGMPMGRGLATILLASDLASGDPWILADMNGEAWRATDWGNAIVRVLSARAGGFEPTLWYPAMSHGDTGAAGGAIALCSALAAWQRGYAPAPRAGILAVSDGVARSSLVVRGPGA